MPDLLRKFARRSIDREGADVPWYFCDRDPDLGSGDGIVATGCIALHKCARHRGRRLSARLSHHGAARPSWRSLPGGA